MNDAGMSDETVIRFTRRRGQLLQAGVDLVRFVPSPDATSYAIRSHGRGRYYIGPVRVPRRAWLAAVKLRAKFHA